MDNKELEKNVESSEKVETTSNAFEFEIPELKDTSNNASQIENNQTENKKEENSTLAPADFSSIFHIESEEKDEPKQVTAQAPKVEVTENQDILTQINDKPQKINKELYNSDERLLYEIKPEKEGNPIVVVLFFCLLFGTILSLPYVSKKLTYEIGGTPVTNNPSNEEEDDKYQFNKSSVRAKIGDLEFTNFVKTKRNDEYLLTFNITNTAERPYQFDKKYYVVMYDEETIVYRALIHSYDAIGSNAADEITLTISERGYTNANKFKIEEIPTARYPEKNIIETEGEYQVLTCRYRNDEMKYYFLDNQLARIKETYTESIESNVNYEAEKSKYQELSRRYNSIEN
ncbi:MAG: hypothetical protein K2H20_02360, partial [Bacilli bacterium]|nr:hypothetical protein [Bacilli bacterium]